MSFGETSELWYLGALSFTVCVSNLQTPATICVDSSSDCLGEPGDLRGHAQPCRRMHDMSNTVMLAFADVGDGCLDGGDGRWTQVGLGCVEGWLFGCVDRWNGSANN